jgi:hypothetical protein
MTNAASGPSDGGPYAPVKTASGAALAKAALAAVVVAGIVLVTIILPAEYGIDPLGTGRALGLDDLFAAKAEVDAQAAAPATITASEGGPLSPRFADFRVDTRELVVPPKVGIEFKYDLDKGATMLYEWKADNFVDFDFHTEKAGTRPVESDSFEKGEGVQKRGGYTAPYDGIHGWYWENASDKPVTITLRAAGFFTEARLFMPKTPPQTVEIPAN